MTKSMRMTTFALLFGFNLAICCVSGSPVSDDFTLRHEFSCKRLSDAVLASQRALAQVHGTPVADVATAENAILSYKFQAMSRGKPLFANIHIQYSANAGKAVVIFVPRTKASTVFHDPNAVQLEHSFFATLGTTLGK